MAKRCLLLAAALTTLAGTSLPANAIPLVDGALVSTFGFVGDGTDQGTFSNTVAGSSSLPRRPGAADLAKTYAFSNPFTFMVDEPGYLATFTVIGGGNTEANDIDNLTLTLTGPAGFKTLTASDAGTTPFVFSASLTNLQLAILGSYVLTVTGDAGARGSSYGGTYAFVAPAPVPLPGGLALMGTLLAGSAGFAALRKRQHKAVPGA